VECVKHLQQSRRPKIKKLAAKAMKSPSMLTTAETRELWCLFIGPRFATEDISAVSAKKIPARKALAKKSR